MRLKLRHRSEIMAIAVPAIISNITTPLLTLADTAIAGHLGSAVYLGAIAVGGSMFNMLYWLCNFLRMGSSGLTAQAYGAADNAAAARILYRALVVALLLAAAMLACRGPIASGILRFMDADDATQTLARRYFEICIFGAPAVMATLAINGWLLGMQNSKATMWIAIFTNVVNISVSLSLVYLAGWKIEGVATGTTVAQWAGALLGALIILFRYRPHIPAPREIFERHAFIAFFRINTDIMLRTACLVAVTLWFTHCGASEGTVVLAANALLLQLFTLFSFFMDGFAFSGEALAGKFHGARRYSSLRSLISELMAIGLACALLFSAIYAFAGEEFLNLLADDPEVLDTARRYLPWAIVIPLCGFCAFVWDGILIGLTRTRIMLASMAIAVALFFLIYLSLKHTEGNDALWMAFNAYLMTRGIAEWIIYRLIKNR
ncbi:MAG: MATE family efflux transporter [Muribaculaceae bacterium]|nr:MATE family efflux transporter [Muribaculaceae bacterium]